MQTAFKLRDDTSKERAERLLLEAITAAVAKISIKELAFALDVSPSLLADALAERSNKGVRASWLVTIIDLAPEHEAFEILRVLAELKRADVSKRKEYTPEEMNERYEEVLRSLGATGLRLIIEARGGKP